MILYLLKGSLLAAGLYLIYAIFLKSNRSFHFNRFYLLLSIVFSLSYPLLDFSINIPVEEGSLFSGENEVVQKINTIRNTPSQRHIAKNVNLIIIIVTTLYTLISLVFLSRLFINLYRLLSISSNDKRYLEGMKCIHHKQAHGVYSFFNRLYLPRDKAAVVNDSILLHEKAHYRQLHSIDVLLVELYIIVFWFNPFAWLLRKAVKTNHEYLADQFVIQQKNPLNYMQDIIRLLQVRNTSELSSHFSYLSIKNRIKMIQNTSKKTFKSSLSITCSLTFGIALMSLFSFKPIEIDKKITHQISSNLNFDLYAKPQGLPIAIEKINKISSKFGMRVSPIDKTKKLHSGVDLVAAPGTEILASDEGKVIKATYNEKFGHHIVIQHNVKYKSMYAHLKSLSVKKGDAVKMGQVIGIIGNSGLSMGTHLHYEIHEFDVKIDPDIKIGC